MDIGRRKAVSIAGGILVAGGIGLGFLRDGSPTENQKEAGAITLGPDGAPTVRVFSDYSCPYCKKFSEEVGPSLKEAAREGQIQYRLFDFPLPVDSRWSRAIPNVGRYVYDEGGTEAFWGFESEIYELQKEYSVQGVANVALNHLESASESDIQTVLDERPYHDEIEEEFATGEEHGVEGTPTILVGPDWMHVEEPSFENIMDAISNR